MKVEESKKDLFLSIVLVLKNKPEEDKIKKYLRTLQRYLDKNYGHYEIIVMDITLKSIFIKAEILKEIPSIRWLKTDFYIETDVVFHVGIKSAIGDYVILLRPIIDPIGIIDGMIQKAMCGHDIIMGVSKSSGTFAYRLMRKFLSGKFLSYIDYNLPPNTTSVVCLNRKYINTILKIDYIESQFFVKLANAGYDIKTYEYEMIKSPPLEKTLSFGIRKTLKLLIFNSSRPFRLLSFLGTLGCLLSFSFSVYSILINLLKRNVVEGWTTITFFFSILFMILFGILIYLGEYMRLLLNKIQDNKNSFYAFEETNSCIKNKKKLNVKIQS